MSERSEHTPCRASGNGGIGKLERKAEAESGKRKAEAESGKRKAEAESGNDRHYLSAHAHVQTSRLPRAARWKERER